MSRKSISKLSQAELAKVWGMSQSGIGKYQKAGCDFNAPEAEIAKWLLKHATRKSKTMREKIESVLKVGRPKAAPPNLDDPKESLEGMADYYGRQLNAATNAEHVDREDVKFWTDLLIKTEESIRRSEAHAKKLGIDRGEMLSREEVERILRAMFWGGNACVSNFSKQIALRLSEKTPQQVHAILKPTLTALMIFEPLKRLSQVPGKIHVPAWVVECARTEEKSYIKVVDKDAEKIAAMEAELKELRAQLAKQKSSIH